MQSCDELRFTPAGVPALDFQLVHESVQREAGGERRVACELSAVALGPIAKALASVTPGAQVRCKGFLARRYRTGTTVALHVNEFELIAVNQPQPDSVNWASGTEAQADRQQSKRKGN